MSFFSELKRRHVYRVAVLYIIGQMLEALEKAYTLREGYLVYIIMGPRFDPLRENQKFKELLKKFEG